MKKSMEPEVVGTSSKIKFEDSDEHESSSEDVEEEIERELAEVTFEELQKARSDGSEVVRDPRFETLCGKLDEEGFKKRYNFLYQKDLPAEKEDLKKQMTRTNDPQVINGLNNRIAWIDKQLKSASTRNTEKVILSEHKKKQREAAKQGKQPYYLKKSEIRQRKIIEKYKELKGSGKLEAFIEKKRRKNASKDHRQLRIRVCQWWLVLPFLEAYHASHECHLLGPNAQVLISTMKQIDVAGYARQGQTYEGAIPPGWKTQPLLLKTYLLDFMVIKVLEGMPKGINHEEGTKGKEILVKAKEVSIKGNKHNYLIGVLKVATSSEGFEGSKASSP
nr:ribosomal RNA processing protein 36 homolog [Ipomoea batatas]GME18227.1 ribosomal RNA processing protein 36 homolog [Ipomoea batatas]